MRTIIVTTCLALGVASAASAQLAAIDCGGAPAPAEGLSSLDDLASQGARPDAALRGQRNDEVASADACRQQARSFRARNSQSPTRRQQELEACLAAREPHRRVEVAGP